MSKICYITRSEKGFVLSTAIPLIAFWMVLCALGYPNPGVDDLNFIGGPINFIKGGEMVNPLLGDGMFAKSLFYHPPFHQYMLAGWLYLFGISTNVLLLFQAFCYIVISLSTALVLPFYGFQRYLVFPITIMLASWMYYMGLRPEALSMACLTAGIVFLMKKTLFLHFVGFVLLGFSLLSYPVILAYAFPFSLLLVISHLRVNRKLKSHYLMRTGGVLLGAMVLVGLLFLLSIHFDISEFNRGYAYETSHRGTTIIDKILILWNAIFFGYGAFEFFPLYILFGMLFFEMIRRRKTTPMILQYIIVGVISGMVISLMLYVKTWQSFVNFFCWVGIVLMISKLPFHTWQRLCFIVLALGVFSVYNSRIIISVCGQKATSESEYGHIRNWVWVQQNNDKQYVVDHVAARYIFDYRLLANTIDWQEEKSKNYSGLQMISLKQKVSNQVWIFSSVQPLIAELTDYQRLNLLGVTFNSILGKPHDVVIVK